jgi:hypothetical protein
MTLDRFVIPPAALVPKPLFPDLPAWRIVEDVRAWVRDGNPTFTWHGHTHTMPDEGEAVEYIGDFKLPKGVEAPCPCCTPETPKFNMGLVAWFPMTKLVRLMGRHCFRRLNPEGHETAYRNLRDRQKSRATLDYLLNNLPKRTQAQAAIERALPIAQHLDDLQDILGHKLQSVLRINLWQSLRDGLKIASGTADKRFLTDYARVDGLRLIDPARKKIRASLETAARGLADLEIPTDLASASEAERAALARRFRRALVIARDALHEIDECSRFLSVQNTATIRMWGALPEATARLYIRRDGRTLMIGETEEEARSVTLDAVIDSPTPQLPEISLDPRPHQ